VKQKECPKTRWKDDIVAAASRSWTDITKDKQRWSSQREAFTQQWPVKIWVKVMMMAIPY